MNLVIKYIKGRAKIKFLDYNNDVRKLLKLNPWRSDYEHNKFKF